MALPAVARKELRDAVRSRSLQFLTLLFVVFAGGLTAIEWVPLMFRDTGVNRETIALLNSMRQPTVLLVPMIGLGLGYGTIAAERDDGRIRTTLGLPNTRAHVVVGKFLGRSGVLVVSVLAAYAVVGAIALGFYETFDLVAFATYTLLTAAYGAVYVAIGVGFSAGMDSRPMALGAATLLYGVFLLGWDLVMVALQAATVGPEPPASGMPEWLQFVGMLNPANAFNVASRAVVPEYDVVTTLPEGSGVLLQDWVGFVVLAAWVVVPLALGYWKFERTDLA